MATAPIRPLELDLLCQKLNADYEALITGTGISPESRRSNFLSKAIAAFVLHEAAGASLEESVAASIDGGLDHGIDSVFVANDQTIWLVQSKYKESGSGEPELGDVSKFRDGVIDLIRGRWERFNNALQTRRAAITDALNSGICKVKVVLAYSGTAVSDDRRDIFSDLERAFSGTNPGFLRCHAYGLTTLHDLHLDGISAQAIEADIELKDFGHTQEPYRAFYGRMDAKRLAELWVQHEDRLVGDFPAIIGQFGQSRLVAQTVLSLTVQDQRLDHLADQMVAFDRPESAHAVGFGGATLAVDGGIDVTARVLLEEFAECAVRKIEHVATTHVEQPF